MKVMHGFIGLFLCLFWASQASAQSEFSSQGSMLPPVGSGLNSPKVIKPTMFQPKEQKSNSSIMVDPKIQFTKNNQFQNPANQVKDKLNNQKEEFNPQYVQKNVDFGTIHTKYDEIKLCYRDYGGVDGDIVSIYTKDMMVLPQAFLDFDCKFKSLGLVKGENIIYFEALNLGQYYPNTGELQLLDKEGNVLSINRWGLETGFKASITVYRD